MACEVGDVIGFQHDIPRWGDGGRLKIATLNSVVLDSEVELLTGETYELLIRFEDDSIAKREITTTVDKFADELIISTPFEKVPKEYDLWAFGLKDMAYKPFRVMNISRKGSDWTTRTIEAIEYIAEVYNEDEEVPDKNYEVPVSSVRGLQVTPTIEDANYYVEISWIPSREQNSKIKVYADKTVIAELSGDTTSLRWEPSFWGNIKYSVSAIDYFGNTTSTTSVLMGTKKPFPEKVPTLTTSLIKQSKQFVFDWTIPDGINPVTGYEIRRGQAWSAARPIKTIVGRNITRDTFIAVQGKSDFWIAAYNKYGYSKEATLSIIDVSSMNGQDVMESIYDYEETGTVEGYGELTGGSLIQWSGITVGYIKENIWGDLKLIDWINGTMGAVVATGRVVDIGKSASIIVWIDEEWAAIPDQPSKWEYQASFDGVNYSEWRVLPTSEVEGRFFVFRVSIQGINRGGILRNATLNIDVPENTIKLPAVAIPKDGIYVAFNPSFVRPPTIQITPNDDALIVKKTEISGNGCYVQLFKGTNVITDGVSEYVEEPVNGVADIFATGF